MEETWFPNYMEVQFNRKIMHKWGMSHVWSEGKISKARKIIQSPASLSIEIMLYCVCSKQPIFSPNLMTNHSRLDHFAWLDARILHVCRPHSNHISWWRPYAGRFGRSLNDDLQVGSVHPPIFSCKAMLFTSERKGQHFQLWSGFSTHPTSSHC